MKLPGRSRITENVKKEGAGLTGSMQDILWLKIPDLPLKRELTILPASLIISEYAAQRGISMPIWRASP